MSKAFLTGSQIYGKPTEASDVDMVVLLTPFELDILKDLCDKNTTEEVEKDGPSDPGPPEYGVSLRFGKLNLLITCDEVAYAAWAKGTEILQQNAPVTRDEAVSLFKRIRAHVGLFKKFPKMEREAAKDHRS